MMSDNTRHLRNKFNTLTLAEARKLNRSMSQTRPAARTASVLNKPRPPPMIVTNLDHFDQPEKDHLGDRESIDRTNSIGGGSLCSVGIRDRRHSINYGTTRACTINSRLSLHSNHPNRRQIHPSRQINESMSNLSFKSSHDSPDSASNPSRFQTLSVDLGSAENYQCSRPAIYGRSLRLSKSHTIARTSASIEPCCILEKFKNSPQKLSDDSYASAKSEVTSDTGWMLHSGFGTPQRQTSNLSNNSKRSSASKTSLTSSTYKAFQNPIANLKRFIRASITRPLGVIDSDKGTKNHNIEKSSTEEASKDETITNDSFKSTLDDSVYGFNRSQTPPVCPPPPGEMKSMNYMSTHDLILKRHRSSLSARPPMQPPPPPPPPLDYFLHQQSDEKHQGQKGDEIDSWQLTSLPVCYERNLATVFEEQKHLQNRQTEVIGQRDNFSSVYQQNNQVYANSSNIQTSDLPSKFDDKQESTMMHISSIGPALTSTHTRSRAGSCQSLASTTTTESIFDFHKQSQQQQTLRDDQQRVATPATPYRFSFAQPLSSPSPLQNVKNTTNLGLPPRVPSAITNSALPGGGPSSNNNATNVVALSRNVASDNNSSSGNSSNCSSQLNVINNNCDRLNSLESSERTSSYSDESTTQAPASGCVTGGNLNGLDNDLDTTILSETSTLQGDATGAVFYMNKCAELERTVHALKNKLINKEKELTDLQVGQLNYDFTIDKLKSQVNKLEKENQQLKRQQLYAV